MNRKFFALLICCVLTLSLTAHACAYETTEYRLDELGMTISLPSEYTAFTRDLDPNDPNIIANGLSVEGMRLIMEEKLMYLNGWDDGVSHEIIVTMVGDQMLINLKLHNDEYIAEQAAIMEAEFNAIGISLLRTEIYHHKQAKFIKFYLSQVVAGQTVYGLEYTTVYANKTINITLQSYTGALTIAQEALLKTIVDSIVFDTAL